MIVNNKRFLIVCLFCLVGFVLAGCAETSHLTTVISVITGSSNPTTSESTDNSISSSTTMTTTIISENSTSIQTTTSYSTMITTFPSSYSTTETINTTQITTTLHDLKLTVFLPNALTYEINDTLDLSGMKVVYTDEHLVTTELSQQDYEIDDVDMSTYGKKTVTISYSSLEVSFSIDVHLPDFYREAEGKTGEELKAVLNAIVRSDFVNPSYLEVIEILQESDRDPSNHNNIILLYSNPSVRNTWDSGGTWDREHVWPRSLLDVSRPSSGTRNVTTDAHNLKPSVPSENNYRGNKYFDYSSSSIAYAPPQNVRGDVARILFYMVIMYEDPSYDLELVDYAPSAHQMGKLSSLLAWNFDDPVDDFERYRNDVIESYQYNRNPFIDYPPFADLIWED